MKKTILALLLLLCVSGCSLLTIEKPDTYVDKIPTIPQEERMSLEGMEALSVGATEINKGLSELKVLVKYAEDLDPAVFTKSLKEFLPRIVAMWDFSYKIMGFVGVASRDIDWENPEKYFEQINAEKEAMNASLSEYKQKELDWKTKNDQFLQDLAQQEEVHKSAKSAMEDERAGWRLTKNFSLGGLLGVFIFVNVVAFLIQVFTKIPVFNMLWGGIFKVFRGLKQTSKAVQDIREKLKKEAANGDRSMTASEALALVDSSFDKHQDEGVKKLVAKVKDKNDLRS